MSISQPVILAVDDDPLNLDIIRDYLSSTGYQLRFADSGEQALQIMHQEKMPVDLVLLDRMMPGMEGIEVLKHIKENEATELTPVIMVTAAGAHEHVAEGIRHGCFYYLVKPFTEELLLEVVNAALKQGACRSQIQESLQNLKALIAKEKSEAHQATMMATYHYLNNALNQLQLVLMEIETKGTIDDDIIVHIRESIFKTSKDLRELGQLENPSRENIEKFINQRL